MASLEELKQKHGQVRLMLLASLVLFLIGLFALVSHWDSAIWIIVFACLFRLVAVWLVRRRYNAAWMQASVVSAAESMLRELSYTAQESAEEGVLSGRGFCPAVSLTPGTQLHHVLRGTLSEKPVTIAEGAFVSALNRGSGAVSGTLLTAEEVLPRDENWVLLWHRPFDALLPLSDYYSVWTALPAPASLPQPDGACFTPGGKSENLPALWAVLKPYCREPGVALAAHDGKLSLFLAGTFYAQKPDITRVPTEKLLRGGAIPGLEVMKKLLSAAGKR